MTRTTGATDAQIEAAAIAEWGKSSLTDPNTIKVVTKYARMLVPTDHRIVRVDDLRAIAELLAYDEYNVDMTSQEERDRYWRIVALIGEAE